MDHNDFWNSIDASKDDKAKGLYYLRERGLEEHIKVVAFLQSFRGESDPKVTYCQVATTLRYDKRIRRCLFKYIGVVEERIRAHLLERYRNDESSVERSSALNKKIKYYKGNFYNAVTHLLFSELVTLFNMQPSDFRNAIFPNIPNLSSNLLALSSLRNQVCHNKFLLDNHELKPCKYDGLSNQSLYASISNLYSLSDDGCREAFAEEIIECSVAKDTKYGNQVDWDLPNDVIVAIKGTVSLKRPKPSR